MTETPLSFSDGRDFVQVATWTNLTMYALGGDDTITFAGQSEGRTVFGGPDEDWFQFRLSGGLNNSVYGNQGNDRFQVNTGANYSGPLQRELDIFGNRGDDYFELSDWAGNLSAWGGHGDDTVSYIVSADWGDQLIFRGGDGDDLVINRWFENEFSQPVLNGVRLFGEFGSDSIQGAAGNDRIAGGRGRDSLQGSSGDDTLKGGKGDDTLEGGDGADVFLFTRASQNSFGVAGSRDLIVDYDASEGDVISLAGFEGLELQWKGASTRPVLFAGDVEIVRLSGAIDTDSVQIEMI